ncbi:hypothetical protein HWV01_16025 [Moritella sp. 5]|uniref:hypothetical protein n=1 Tax=Moritella sp. 5 TaxID=2746231 RepID=UPI001BAD591E|nr:hypothetical protein [Moritella sp. 5]QUM81681.1 hypothetical protein HWV01_16025 [Moritella sp. 5]
MDNLIDSFQAYNTEVLKPYYELISTKDHMGNIFPPYIPHIGSEYDKYKIIMYGMAQNVSEPWDSLLNKTRREKVCQMLDAGEYENIWIAPYKVMLAIAGLYIHAKFGDKLSSFTEIHNSISVTNYYKFSMNDGADINPDHKLKNHQCPILYWSENDRLSSQELDALSPNTVISFNGRHNRILRQRDSEFIKINDPSWVLQGGGGHLKASGSWYRECADNEVISLIDGYLDQIDDKYSSKIDALKIYLLKYYSDWKCT